MIRRPTKSRARLLQSTIFFDEPTISLFRVYCNYTGGVRAGEPVVRRVSNPNSVGARFGLQPRKRSSFEGDRVID